MSHCGAWRFCIDSREAQEQSTGYALLLTPPQLFITASLLVMLENPSYLTPFLLGACPPACSRSTSESFTRPRPLTSATTASPLSIKMLAKPLTSKNAHQASTGRTLGKDPEEPEPKPQKAKNDTPTPRVKSQPRKQINTKTKTSKAKKCTRSQSK